MELLVVPARSKQHDGTRVEFLNNTHFKRDVQHEKKSASGCAGPCWNPCPCTYMCGKNTRASTDDDDDDPPAF
jgi:hypothetical protein